MNRKPIPSSRICGTVVSELMIRRPKALSYTATLAAVRESLGNDHVHMVLLVEDEEIGQAGDAAGPILRGTIVRADLPPDAPVDELALPHARVAERTVKPDDSAVRVHARMLADGARRLAVVDHEHRLLGLLCLKRHRHDFCTDVNVAARAGERGRVQTQDSPPTANPPSLQDHGG
jgi:CBS domain-containing protein